MNDYVWGAFVNKNLYFTHAYGGGEWNVTNVMDWLKKNSNMVVKFLVDKDIRLGKVKRETLEREVIKKLADFLSELD